MDHYNNSSCHLLVYHSLDVAAVGSVLFDHLYFFGDKISKLLSIHRQSLKELILFLLSVHDVGKFSETFQNIKEDLYEKLQGSRSLAAYTCRHDTLGYLIFNQVWKQIKTNPELKLSPDHPLVKKKKIMDLFSHIVSGHHGAPPKPDRKYAEDFFNDKDIQASSEFIEAMWGMFCSEIEKGAFNHDSFLKSLKCVSWWLAGFTVLCDWIGSDEKYFNFEERHIPLKEYWNQIALVNAGKAVKDTGLIPPLKRAYQGPKDLFEYIHEPTPLQSFCDSVTITKHPQLFIMEDVTGAGKTEAAIILAHRLMEKGQGEGLYVGLPTMATANAMYERMGMAYGRLYEDDAMPSLILAHSTRHLSEKFRVSILTHHAGSHHYHRKDSTASATLNAWLATNKKKALLADVGIGTIDQALLSVLPVKHQSLRLFGLMGKVLILDEIHAYDEYTNELILKLLEFQAAIGCSVILLSATLTQKLRNEMTGAFLKGFPQYQIPDNELKNGGYPLITHVTPHHISEINVDTRKESKRCINVQLVHDISEISQRIIKKVKEGGGAGWFRNTVADALFARKELIETYGVPDEKIILFHSRFTFSDRWYIEEKIIKWFGKHSKALDRADKILISSPAGEQSLDFDMDTLFTDLSYMDILIQRFGREKRHVRHLNGDRNFKAGATDERGEAIVTVFSPKAISNPDPNWYRSYFPKGNFVYPHTRRLWRTARLLKKKSILHIPEDLRELMERVYNEDMGENIQDALETPSFKEEGEAYGRQDLGRFNTLKLNGGYCRKSMQPWEEEAHFSTRIGDERATIYLARIENDHLIPWSDGLFPWDLSSLPIHAKKIMGLSPETPPSGQKKISQLKEHEDALNDSSIVIPLSEFKENVWFADIIDSRNTIKIVFYSKEMGLLFEDEI